MSDQLVAEATTYTTHNKHRRRTSMLFVGFELAIPVIKQLQTYALDHTATRINRPRVLHVSLPDIEGNAARTCHVLMLINRL
jgi:hypothetical protein